MLEIKKNSFNISLCVASLTFAGTFSRNMLFIGGHDTRKPAYSCEFLRDFVRLCVSQVTHGSPEDLVLKI